MHGDDGWFGQRYRIIREIGRGGAAVVYQAWDERLGTHVGLKVLDPELASANVRRRFRREATLQANLSHPSIVAATDWLEDGDRLAMVMAYVNGPDLSEWLTQRGHLTPDEIDTIMTPVCSAIAYAHSQGVLHRDLKPANILLRRQGDRLDALVTDFGVAKITSGRAGQTQVGAVIGTPEYMPPEQLRGAPDLDARVDVFALGVMLYEMATGRRPTHIDGEPQPPSTLVPSFGPDFDALVGDAMQPVRSRRVASVEALAARLAPALGRPNSATHADSSPPGSSRHGTSPGSRPVPPPTVLETAGSSSIRPAPSIGGDASLDAATPRRSPLRLLLALLVAVAATGLYYGPLHGLEPPQQAHRKARGFGISRPDAASRCICAPSPTRRVDVTCPRDREAAGTATNDRLGTEWLRTAEQLRTRDPAQARTLAWKAAEAFACVRQARPRHSRTLGNLGWALELLGDREKALDLQDRMRDHTTNENLLAAAWFSTARLRCANGDAPGARQAIERSLRLKPSGKGVETRRALLARIGDSCDG